jgi:hypothetical protein
MDQFYLTLPSNSSMGFYPKNTAASYITQLRKPIVLHGQWEVAMVEIHFPHTFYNFREGDNLIKVIKSEDVQSVIVDVQPDYYHDWPSFQAVLNKSLEGSMAVGVGSLVDDSDGRVVFMAGDVSKIKMSPTLLHQLGYEPGTDIIAHPRSTRSVNMDRGLPHLLYCYCDIIEGQLVGDAVAPLLRIVNAQIDKYMFGLRITQSFTMRMYVNVQKREFSEIQIDIRDTSGRVIPFAFGSSAVVLHFKRVKE